MRPGSERGISVAHAICRSDILDVGNHWEGFGSSSSSMVQYVVGVEMAARLSFSSTVEQNTFFGSGGLTIGTALHTRFGKTPTLYNGNANTSHFTTLMTVFSLARFLPESNA